MPTTHKKNFLKKYGLPEDTSLSLEDISHLTDIPIAALQIIWNRGIGAWKSSIDRVRLEDGTKNPDTKKYPRKTRMSKERLDGARVYSFVMNGKTFETADRDVAEHYGLI